MRLLDSGASRRRAIWLLALSLIAKGFAQQPYGLDTRAPIGPYLDGVMPSVLGSSPLPTTLSATRVFQDLATREPANGIIPYSVNSALWSDGAVKTRWLAVANNGPPYTADEQISFAPTGEWSFPNGTVFIKEFDLTVNEATGERRRLETRFLVRDATGGVYGVTYKWRPDNSDADLLPDGLNEDIPISTVTGQTRIQTWSYPSRAQCLICHNQAANYVLGVKTHQLNGSFTYPSTGRTDNQLRTLAHLGLLNPVPTESAISTYLKSVSVNNTTAPIQDRMRSWLDANCSQCHRPNGFCPQFDARYYTPLAQQNLVNTYLRYRDLAGSELYQRDNSLGPLKMPPLAKNVVHEAAMEVLRQWVASPLEILSVYLQRDTSHLAVRFNSHVDPGTGTDLSNYSLEGGTVLAATAGDEPDTVTLTVSPLVEGQAYVLTTTGVRDRAPSANTIWPFTRSEFVAQYFVPSQSSRLANVSGRVRVGPGDEAAIQGLVVRGHGTKRIMIRALGPSLAEYRLGATLPDPVLELYDSGGRRIAANDNWADNPNQQEIIDTGLAPASLLESVILLRLPASETGTPYTAVLREAGESSGVALLEVYDLDDDLAPPVLNTSTRGYVGVGEEVLIAGLAIGDKSSSTNLRVVVRALGPSLTAYGVQRALPDPSLSLFDRNGNLLGTNDSWKENETELRAAGLSPPSDLEPAMPATLPPGNYTVVVKGGRDQTGIALVETYVLP